MWMESAGANFGVTPTGREILSGPLVGSGSIKVSGNNIIRR